MLVKFTVGNFLSFKEKVTLDLSSEGLKDKNSYFHIPYLHNHKIELLKSSVIYGHNASGKSNLIRAYATFNNFVLNSFSISRKENDIKIEPFRLNTSMADKASYFEVLFIIKQTKYRYGFEVLNKIITKEWLHYADGPVRENTLYKREGQHFTEISKLWNKSSNNVIEQTKIFTKSTSLFLSVLLSQDNIPRIEDIYKWLDGNKIIGANYLARLSDAKDIYTHENYRSTILKFLDSADLGFTNIFEKTEHLTNDLGYHKDLVDTLFSIEQRNFNLYTTHRVFDANGNFQNMVEFDLQKNESSGSIKYFIIACFLSYAIKNGQLIWIDELDASLHTQLIIFLTEVFNSEKNNTSGAQLIFTAHNTIVLDNHLRRDQIWFVQKDEFGESKLLKGHTSESPIRINKSIEDEYRKGTLKKGVSKKLSSRDLPSLFDDTPPPPTQ